MWGEFCNIYSPNAEKDKKLKELDLHTLDYICNELNETSNYLKGNDPKSKYIAGMVLARQIVFDMIIDKE